MSTPWLRVPGSDVITMLVPGYPLLDPMPRTPSIGMPSSRS